MTSCMIEPGRRWRLPPLILHPFSDAAGPEKLAESSRASLILQGLLPKEEFTFEELNRQLLDGRFHEVRMLFYVGKDLTRWIEQCMDFVSREESLQNTGIESQSFASLLMEDPPAPVREKLRSWGVVDYRSIFSRAIGLNAVFSTPPGRESLSEGFIRHHYRYADHMFHCRQELKPFTKVRGTDFQFEMYASGEYTRLLERQWEEE